MARCFTTPIYYLNDRTHLGHFYTSTACDVLGRFWRLNGDDVHVVTGGDAHGQKVECSAEERGVSPSEYVDELLGDLRVFSDSLGFEYDDFICTVEKRHHISAQALWNALVEKGQIYEGVYEGYYSVRDEAYVKESDLVDGKAPTGAPVEWISEPCFFFRLSAWGDQLLSFYDKHPDFVIPETRFHEVKSFVRMGLNDLAVSRRHVSWGIPVPGDEKSVIYVWFEALVNYITSLGYPDTESEKFKAFWPAVHIVGKDILIFHAVYWPAFLMAAGITPPRQVIAHGWWICGKDKMSKSLGNVVDPAHYVERYGLDPLRYFVMRHMNFGEDGQFSEEFLAGLLKDELSNSIGNLAQRVLAFIQKHMDGAVPNFYDIDIEDEELRSSADSLFEAVRTHIERYRFSRCIGEVIAVVTLANQYIAKQKPWTLIGVDDDGVSWKKCQTIMYRLADLLRIIGIILQPFIPASAGKLLDQLSVHERSFSALSSRLVSGTKLPSPSPLFPNNL